MISRRALLRSLLALPIAATFDVEKLLWVPGQMIAVPPVPFVAEIQFHRISLDAMNAVVKENFLPHIPDLFLKDDPLYRHLRNERPADTKAVVVGLRNGASRLTAGWWERTDDLVLPLGSFTDKA